MFGISLRYIIGLQLASPDSHGSSGQKRLTKTSSQGIIKKSALEMLFLNSTDQRLSVGQPAASLRSVVRSGVLKSCHGSNLLNANRKSTQEELHTFVFCTCAASDRVQTIQHPVWSHFGLYPKFSSEANDAFISLCEPDVARFNLQHPSLARDLIFPLSDEEISFTSLIFFLDLT